MGTLVMGCDAASAIQGRLPGKAMKDAGIAYCWLRGKVGNNPGRDALFAENVQILSDAGIIKGRYDFPFPLRNLDPLTQADGFTEAAMIGGHPVGSNQGELPSAYDLEWPPPEDWAKRNIDADFIVDFALAQLERIERDTNAAPIIYSYPWFIACLVKAKNFVHLLKYRLWIAGGPNYINGNGVFPTVFSPPKVAGWGASALFWQWDGNGGRRLPGTNVDADFDVFGSDLLELERICQIEQPPPTIAEPPPLEIIAQQAATAIVEDGIHAYRQERMNQILEQAGF